MGPKLTFQFMPEGTGFGQGGENTPSPAAWVLVTLCAIHSTREIFHHRRLPNGARRRP